VLIAPKRKKSSLSKKDPNASATIVSSSITPKTGISSYHHNAQATKAKMSCYRKFTREIKQRSQSKDLREDLWQENILK
jgi:hypothetical protein